MSRPFAVIGFTVFFTIALLYKFETGVTVAALTVFTAALVIALLIKNIRINRVIPCSIASAIMACILLLSSVYFSYLPLTRYCGMTCDISATLISEPEFEYGNCYYTARVTKIGDEDADFKLRLTFSNVPDAEPYDEMHGMFTFYIPGASNDASLSANKSNGIYIAAYPHENDYRIISVPESEKPFGKTIINIRTAIKNAVYRILPNENGDLAVALLIGDKSGLSADILNDFSFIGITHIICVSGYHLSLWSMLIYEVLRKTRAGSKISSVICVVAVIFFMFISGMTYSVIRSGIMTVTHLLSNVVMRKRDPLNSLGLSLVLIAAFNPFAMGSASLQLSALATAGIIFYSEYFAQIIEKSVQTIKNNLFRKITGSVITSLMVTISATAFTLPVSLSLYNRFNFIVFAANIIAVPVSGLCMVLCALGSLIGSVFGNIINIPAYFGGLLSKFLIKFSEKLAEFKGLSFVFESDETAIIIISLFLICIMSLLFAYYGKSFPVLTAVLCSFVFIINVITFSVSEKFVSKIRVVDCGNGTSVVVSKGNESFIVGCGGTEFLGSYNLCQAVSETGNKIRTVIIPDDKDKSSAYLNNVIKEFQPDELFCNKLPSGSSLLLNDVDIYDFDDDKDFKNFDVFCENINESSFTFIRNEDISVLILFDSFVEISSIPNQFQKFDVLIVRNDYPSQFDKIDSLLIVLNSENSRGVIIQNELESLGFNCLATGGCGDIIIKADDGAISSYRDK